MSSILSADRTLSPRPNQKPHHRALVWIRRILLGLVVALVAVSLVGATYQVIATKIDERKFQPPGRLVDVGGRYMHLQCAGVKRGPTIILEQGGGGTSLAWFLVQPQLAGATQACAYDRAGMGWSDAGPQPRDGRQIASDLHALLHNAGIEGPYVLAGHSYGGLFVRAYAAQYPDEVAGLVLLDATHPDVWSRTPEGQRQYQSDSQAYRATRWLVRLGLIRLNPNISGSCSLGSAEPHAEPKSSILWGIGLLSHD